MLALRCVGGILSKIVDVPFVVSHVELLFKSTSHSDDLERLGCAKAVAYAASVHTLPLLTHLENIAKWEYQAKAARSGIWSMIKENMSRLQVDDADSVSLRATLLLTYGYVLWYCPVDLVAQRYEQTVIRFLQPYIEAARVRFVAEC